MGYKIRRIIYMKFMTHGFYVKRD